MNKDNRFAEYLKRIVKLRRAASGRPSVLEKLRNLKLKQEEERRHSTWMDY